MSRCTMSLSGTTHNGWRSIQRQSMLFCVDGPRNNRELSPSAIKLSPACSRCVLRSKPWQCLEITILMGSVCSLDNRVKRHSKHGGGTSTSHQMKDGLNLIATGCTFLTHCRHGTPASSSLERSSSWLPSSQILFYPHLYTPWPGLQLLQSCRLG